MYFDCVGRPDLATGAATTALNCSTSGSVLAMRPAIETFASGNAETWFQQHTSGFKVGSGCASGAWLGHWSYGSSVAGQLGCAFITGGLLRIVWVVGNQIGIVAEGSDAQAVYNWWKSNSCALTAGC